MSGCQAFVKGFYAPGSVEEAVNCYEALRKAGKWDRSLVFNPDTRSVYLDVPCKNIIKRHEGSYITLKEVQEACRDMGLYFEIKCWGLGDRHALPKVLEADEELVLVRMDYGSRVKYILLKRSLYKKQNPNLKSMGRANSFPLSRIAQMFTIDELGTLCVKLDELSRLLSKD